MAFDFNADHIAAASGGYEPQRLNHFSVRFADLGQAEIIEKSLLSWTPPQRDISEVVIPYANEQRKVAGSVTITDATMVIVDHFENDSWQAFHDWLNLVHNVREGTLGLASDYKKEGTANYFGPDGSKRAWNCVGCWPKGVNSDQFSMDSGGEKNTLTVNMACDKVLPASEA